VQFDAFPVELAGPMKGVGSALVSAIVTGADAAVLAKIAGLNIDPKVEMLVAETEADDLFVIEEQMMPLMPVVRAGSFKEAVRLAKDSEHDYKHSAMVHTMNVSNMTLMAQAMDTTIFVKNGPCTAGPCTAGLGMGGEGYISFSIATTTGEGITPPAPSHASAAAPWWISSTCFKILNS